MANRRKRKKIFIPRGYIYIATALLFCLLLAAAIIYVKRYMPTSEHMELSDYFETYFDNEAAVVLDGEYITSEQEEYGYALINDDTVYLEIGFVKDYLDDGYVYDSTEITLRYATDTDVYTATLGSSDYMIDKSNNSLSHAVLIAQDDTVYIAEDYLELLTDFKLDYYSNPNRVFVTTVGTEVNEYTVKHKSQIRKLNGPKSLVLEDVVKGETIYVIRDTGKWSFVISENGVMGYIKNSAITYNSTDTVSAELPERTYNHISLGKEVNLAWHQVTSQTANSDIANTLASAGNINVISPTWYYLSNNSGGIHSIASSDYVTYCHNNGVQVWGLVSNLEDSSVDTATVLNTTSARDNLVNNLIAAAITVGLDGINVDIEELPGSAADGYIQFIKELSIKCEKNDIILSVDNYVPTASSECYNRAEQANYADYVIIMGYDEHYGSSDEAGSVASIDWVEQGVIDTLEEVPAEQVVLGMPFYCRVWAVSSDGSVSSTAYGMDAIQSYLSTNGVSVTWSDEYGQYYGEYTSGDTTYMIWVEDETSIEEKLKVMDSYGLAGGAFWKLGFDSSAVWNVIAKYL